MIDKWSAPLIFVREAQAETTSEVVEKKVQIEVVYSKEGIERLIRETFPESPETAVRIAKCESGLIATAKGPTSDYGIFQINKPSWDKKAKKMGLTEYQTDVEQNIKMARYIYENAGHSWNDWVCYTKKMY